MPQPDLKVRDHVLFGFSVADVKVEGEEPRGMGDVSAIIAPAPLSRFRDRLPDGSEGPEMVVLPAGEFLMGSPATELGRQDDEGPQHRVSIRAFALGRFAVTVAEFRCFADGAPYRTDAEEHGGGYGWNSSDEKWERRNGCDWRTPGFDQGPDHPVVCISFRDAAAYVQWLCEQTRCQYRLPSEAEWEYAARGGTTTACITGDTLSSQQANFALESRGTRPVGSYPANPFGLHEVHGNVWEWVQDCWHANYEGAPSDGRAWLAETGGASSFAVLHRGSWMTDYSVLRGGGLDQLPSAPALRVPELERRWWCPQQYWFSSGQDSLTQLP